MFPIRLADVFPFQDQQIRASHKVPQLINPVLQVLHPTCSRPDQLLCYSSGINYEITVGFSSKIII